MQPLTLKYYKVMINRALIRLKIVQIVYAYYQNGGKNLDTAEKELFFRLSKAYDLYNYLLLLMVAITKYAEKRILAGKNKMKPSPEELNPNMKFVENRFILQLEENEQLLYFVENQKKTWDNEDDLVRALYEKLRIITRNTWPMNTVLIRKTASCGEKYIRI